MRYETYEGDTATGQLPAVLPIYTEVYAEPPYGEGPEDVAGFVTGWPRRSSAPGFRLVLAYDGDAAVGMTFGHQLPDGTGWWTGLLEDTTVDTAEWPGRTFAIIELAVLKPHRGAGLGRRLHDLLLEGRGEERVTLLVRPEPEARPAQAMYEHLGYQRAGAVRPYDGAPVYDALVRPLP